MSRLGGHDVPPAPVYRSLIRPMLVMGCERELILTAALAAGFLVVVIKTWASVIAGILLWLGAAAGLSQLAKIDAQMSSIFRRHIKYVHFYPANASRWGHTRDRWKKW